MVKEQDRDTYPDTRRRAVIERASSAVQSRAPTLSHAEAAAAHGARRQGPESPPAAYDAPQTESESSPAIESSPQPSRRIRIVHRHCDRLGEHCDNVKGCRRVSSW